MGKIEEVEQKAIAMANGYVGLTPELDIWTYASEPNPNKCLCGLLAAETKKRDQEWKGIVFYEIMQDIKMGEIENLELID